MKNPKTVFILSITSDIGQYLARHYLSLGCHVFGTYRDKSSVGDLAHEPNVQLWPCDVSQLKSIKALIHRLTLKHLRWDIFISCVGDVRPAVPFFQCPFEEWQKSVELNSLAQLRVLHGLYPLRHKNPKVVLFAGGGMNGAVVNLSAYTISKIMLAKMCEFLDAENKELHISIIGPGWTKTKIHRTLLLDKKTNIKKAQETKKFLKVKQGTPLEDIAQCIDWVISLPKRCGSGRNFSVVNDAFKGDNQVKLKEALALDVNMYKLRRSGNEAITRK